MTPLSEGGGLNYCHFLAHFDVQNLFLSFNLRSLMGKDYYSCFYRGKANFQRGWVSTTTHLLL